MQRRHIWSINSDACEVCHVSGLALYNRGEKTDGECPGFPSREAEKEFFKRLVSFDSEAPPS